MKIREVFQRVLLCCCKKCIVFQSCIKVWKLIRKNGEEKLCLFQFEMKWIKKWIKNDSTSSKKMGFFFKETLLFHEVISDAKVFIFSYTHFCSFLCSVLKSFSLWTHQPTQLQQFFFLLSIFPFGHGKWMKKVKISFPSASNTRDLTRLTMTKPSSFFLIIQHIFYEKKMKRLRIRRWGEEGSTQKPEISVIIFLLKSLIF